MLLFYSPLWARKKVPSSPEQEAQIQKLQQEIDSVKGQLKVLISKRKELLEQMAVIREQEKALRSEESALRSNIASIKKGLEIENKLKDQKTEATQIAPLVNGPIKHGMPLKGTSNVNKCKCGSLE